MPTAAVIIIGDEILSGKFQDENGPYMTSFLSSVGVVLKRVSIIDDSVATISAEVRQWAKRYDWVFTTGGIGPTHDDVTYEGIAAAFQLENALNPEIVALLDTFGVPPTISNRKMAMVPVGSILIPDPVGGYPIVQVQNVFIFPGIPRLLKKKLSAVASLIQGKKPFSRVLHTNEIETDMAETLFEIDQRHGEVTIGSYPRLDEQEFRVLITVESDSKDALDACCVDIEERISLVSIDEAQREA